MSEAISVGSVSVDIVPDVRKLPEELKAKTSDLTITVGTKLDDATLKREMDELTRDRQVAVRANLDDAGATARIDELTRDRTIKVKADTSQARKAMSGLGGMGLLPSLALGLGPALIPVGGAALGAGGALAAPLAAAGGGLAIGGAIAGAAVKRTKEQLKQIAELKKKMEAAQAAASSTGLSVSTSAANSLAGARTSAHNSIASAQASLAAAKTPAARAAAERRIATARATLAAHEASISASASARQAVAQQKVADATAAYKNALAALTPAQRKFKDSQDNLKASFDRLIKTAGPAILGPVTKGMDLLSKVMPKLVPVLDPVSRAIGSLLGDLGKAAGTKQFGDFVTWFGKLAGSSIVSFGHDLGNLALGFGGLFRALSPLSGGLLDALGNMTQKFADFGAHASSSKGVQGFMDYVRREGPKVAKAVGDIAGVLGRIIKGLAPFGDVVLSAVGGIASFLKTADPGTISALGIAVGGLALAFGKGPLGLAFALGATLSHSKGFVSFLKTAGGYAKDMADAFDRLPTGVKVAAAAALGVGAVGKKLGAFSAAGLGKSAIDKVFGTALSKARPLPVYVVNEGFGGGGGPGVPGGEPVPGGGSPKPGRSGGIANKIAPFLPVLPALGSQVLTPQDQGLHPLPIPKSAQAEIDKMNRKVKDTTTALGVQNDAWMKVRGNVVENRSAVKDLADRVLGLGRYIEHDKRQVDLLIQALKNAGSIYAGLPKGIVQQAVVGHENKFDRTTGAGRVTFVHNGNVVSNHPRDYVKWNQDRSRRQNGGGVTW